MIGELNILNTGAGDIAIVFNQHDAAERDKAITMLKDMQARGYALLMQLDDGSYTRVVDVDARRGRYIIQLPTDLPVTAAGPAAEEETCGIVGTTDTGDQAYCVLPRGHKPVGRHRSVTGFEWKGHRGGRRAGQKRGGRRVSVPVERARATGVARSAGG